jgi:C4-dicarboxylate-specific signal transduction histidine kinase
MFSLTRDQWVALVALILIGIGIVAIAVNRETNHRKREAFDYASERTDRHMQEMKAEMKKMDEESKGR